MPYKKRVFWTRKLEKLMPEEGTFYHSVLRVVKVLGFFALIKIDEIWCSIVHPDERPNLK